MFHDDHRREEDRRPLRDQTASHCEPFTRHLELSEERERQQVGDSRVRGSEVRILATVGAFRMVPRDELERSSALPREVERLRQAGLLSTTPYMVGHRRTTIVSLTREGLGVLERHRRDCPDEERQWFYAGISKPKELAHDSRLFEVYRHAQERLERDGVKVRRVVLEQQLKSDYQRFLQEPNRGRSYSSGKPRQDREAVARWAAECNLPIVNGAVRFPDVRIEYERPDRTLGREDIEIVTENYRGAHAAATAAAGFKCHRYSAPKLGGARGSARGGRARDPRLAEEMLP